MSEMLKVDKNFTPCRVDDGDELFPNGIFVFNVTRIIEHIAKHPEDTSFVEADVDGFMPKDLPPEAFHAPDIDISKPVILAEIAPGIYNLIDGHHRIEKARQLGIGKVPAYKLQVHEHIPFLTSTTAYLSYVEYWNEKLKALQYAARTCTKRRVVSE